jgi:hypothetical protein
MTDKPSFWERAFPPPAKDWRRWIVLDPQRRTDAEFWKLIRKRLAKAGITVETASDAAVLAAIWAHDDLIGAYVGAAERALYAVKLRDDGLSFRQIGVALGGCGPERARQIHARGERIWRGWQLWLEAQTVG